MPETGSHVYIRLKVTMEASLHPCASFFVRQTPCNRVPGRYLHLTPHPDEPRIPSATRRHPDTSQARESKRQPLAMDTMSKRQQHMKPQMKIHHPGSRRCASCKMLPRDPASKTIILQTPVLRCRRRRSMPLLQSVSQASLIVRCLRLINRVYRGRSCQAVDRRCRCRCS
jgi:hypothetical protein